MSSTKWKNGLFWLFRPHTTDLKVHLFVAHSPGGLWPLASTDARQHPLFCASIHCTRSLLGPGLNSYPGINFFLLLPWMNLSSTYCGRYEYFVSTRTLIFIFFPIVNTRNLEKKEKSYLQNGTSDKNFNHRI